MSPTLKKICILSLATALGQLVRDKIDKLDLTGIEKVMLLDNAADLDKAGFEALKKCHGKIDNSLWKRASRKVTEACLTYPGEEFDVTMIISMLFYGLNDLALYCKTVDIKPVEDAALNFITVWDPNLEDEDTHAVAYHKYMEWIK